VTSGRDWLTVAQPEGGRWTAYDFEVCGVERRGVGRHEWSGSEGQLSGPALELLNVEFRITNHRSPLLFLDPVRTRDWRAQRSDTKLLTEKETEGSWDLSSTPCDIYTWSTELPDYTAVICWLVRGRERRGGGWCREERTILEIGR
jgi:hypothetical protein